MKMKQIGIIGCVLLIVSLIGCGGDQFDNTDKNSVTGKASPRRKARGEADNLEVQKRPKRPPKGWIKNISFSKKLGQDGTALKVGVETTQPLEESHYFSYIYWRNGTKIEETPLDSLSPASYNKGDVIFADVVLHNEGEIIEQRRSEMLQVENSSPIINKVNIPEIDGPGIYRIYVKAKDPDGDKITFSLAGDPLPEGLKIDPGSGTITCILGEKPPPEKMKFTITADDGDKGITKKIVTITFKITKPKEGN